MEANWLHDFFASHFTGSPWNERNRIARTGRRLLKHLKGVSGRKFVGRVATRNNFGAAAGDSNSCEVDESNQSETESRKKNGQGEAMTCENFRKQSKPELKVRAG